MFKISGILNNVLKLVQRRFRLKVHNNLTVLHSPNTPSWRGAQLKHRDSFTLPYCPTIFYDREI